MSRIGNQPINVPKGVDVKVVGRDVTVKGPKGQNVITVRREVDLEVAGGVVVVRNHRPARDRQARAYHGLTRALLQNAVVGVVEGYERKLEINGVGYLVKQQGKNLVFALGYANDVVLPIPATVQVEVPNATNIVVRGCDKQQVGEFAAKIRKLKPPEPYKGKGIKYDFETIRRKAGKTLGSA